MIADAMKKMDKVQNKLINEKAVKFKRIGRVDGEPNTMVTIVNQREILLCVSVTII